MKTPFARTPFVPSAYSVITYIDLNGCDLFRKARRSWPLAMPLRPKTVWQKIGKPQERFPLGRSFRQPVVEASIDDQVLAHGTGYGPQIPHGVSTDKRLRKMPDLPGKCEPS